MDLRGWEDGESESRTVMVQIGVERTSKITPHESGQTSIGCLSARELEKPTLEIRQMTAGWPHHCWCDLPQRSHCEVCRQQVRIAQATQKFVLPHG